MVTRDAGIRIVTNWVQLVYYCFRRVFIIPSGILDVVTVLIIVLIYYCFSLVIVL